MKKLALLTLCAGLFYSCTVYEMPSSSSSRAGESSSSSAKSKYCCHYEGAFYPTEEKKCAVGTWMDWCPNSSSSSN